MHWVKKKMDYEKIYVLEVVEYSYVCLSGNADVTKSSQLLLVFFH